MLAISPIDQLCTLTWLIEDPIISQHEQENPNLSTINVCTGRENLITETTSDYSIDQYFHDRSDLLGARINNNDEYLGFTSADHWGNGDSHTAKMVKKLNHNASERDRRRKINKLYADLRSLLPAEDQSKKLSIPATVSRVLKYLPELRDEVDKLSQKMKNLIMSKISTQKEDEEELSINYREKLIKRRKTDQISSSAISTTQMSDREIIIQISIPKSEKGSLCGALTYLEMEGFLVQSASSFKSFDGRVSCILHIQEHESRIEDAGILKEKILSFF